MAETASASPLKRYREEEERETIDKEETKRQKPDTSSSSSSSTSSCSSYDQILCLLEEAEEQDQPHRDLTSLITTLQQEISHPNDVVSLNLNAGNVNNAIIPPNRNAVNAAISANLNAGNAANAVVSANLNAANVQEEKPTLSSSSSFSSSSWTSSCASKEEDDEGDKERVMRHLLEASDDELGIPSTDFGGSNYEMDFNAANQDYVNGGSLLDGFSDALWELEDEAANYYTLLQSELFM